MAKGSSVTNDYIHVRWFRGEVVIAEAVALDIDTAWRLLGSTLAEQNLEEFLTLKVVKDNVAGPTRLLFVLPDIWRTAIKMGEITPPGGEKCVKL